MPNVHSVPPCGPAPVEVLPVAAPVVVIGGTPLPDPEYDHSILCDPNTDERVIVTTFFNPSAPPTIEAFTLDGAPYGGDVSLLVACDTPEDVTESDAIAFCDGNDTVFQHIVKLNGVPTGAVFWTSTLGGIITPPTNPVVGACAQVADVNKSSDGIVVTDDGVAGQQVVTFTTVMDGLSVTNCSNCFLVVELQYDSGIIQSGDGTAVVAPNSTVSLSFQDANDVTNADAIMGLRITSINVDALANGQSLGSDMVTTPKTGQPWLAVVNGVES